MIADAASLAPRAVFAFACHTATEMGRVFAENGTDWWGYTGAISSPTTDPEILPLFVEIFRFMRWRLTSGSPWTGPRTHISASCTSGSV